SVQIHRGRSGECMSIAATGAPVGSRGSLRQIAEDALARRTREHSRDHILLLYISLLVDEYEKERLVLLDRSTEAATELIPIAVRLAGTDDILKPSLCGQCRVLVRIEEPSMKVIASGAGLHLHLSRTASRRGIDTIDDDLHFFDEVGAGENGGVRAVPVVV